jgi:uncharacterized protein YvpB
MKCIHGVKYHILRVIALAMTINSPLMHGADHAFLGWDSFGRFAVAPSEDEGSQTYRIPVSLPAFEVREMIPSWNMIASVKDRLEVRLEARFEGSEQAIFHLGRWTSEAQTVGSEGGRTSIKHQRNALGVVYTDTLVFQKRPMACDVVLTIWPHTVSQQPELTFFGLCLSGPRTEDYEEEMVFSPVVSDLNVPRLCQMDYPGGNVWCSPTSVAMILSYWSRKLNRPDLQFSVPRTAAFVFDPGWPGTGNWSFNVAFAGSHPGMRAFVARLNSLEELEEWVVDGIPVAVSVSYDLLKGKQQKGSNDGHLVVVTGFDMDGNPILNDPARCPQVRLTYPLKHFKRAWRASRQTAYLIYPTRKMPPESFQFFVR